jgi:GTPase SAR1 family protein
MNTKELSMLNIGLIGDLGVGKSSYVNNLSTNMFDMCYTLTDYVMLKELRAIVNNGKNEILFRIFDFSRVVKDDKSLDIYKKCNVFLVFFDVSNELSFRNIREWILDIRINVPESLIILCGNKIDLIESRKVYPSMVRKKYDYPYFDISVRTLYNLYEPLVESLRLYIKSRKTMVKEMIDHISRVCKVPLVLMTNV